MKTLVLSGADPNVASPQVQWRWEAERRGKPRSPRPPERNQSPDKLVLNWKRRALSLLVGNERLVQNSGVKIGNLFIDNLSDVKSSQVLKLAILKKLSQKRVADFHDEDGTHPDWASVSFGLTFDHTIVHSMTCLIVIWLPVGWTMKKYLSQAMRRIEKEEKKTQVDWIAPISLHKISWRRKKHFLVYLCISTCHVLSKSPIVGEDVDKSERHGEGAEEDVGHGQGGDEDVPRGQHHLWE